MKVLFARQAWVRDRWERDVALTVAVDGTWAKVETGVDVPPGAQRLAGPVLPGFVNAHSHAFQRAFAGLAERRDSTHDDFWSWRDRMYGVALRVGVEAMQAIGARLYVELLRGGYTEVCEFHYVHRDPDGDDYPEPGAMAWALAAAADEAGLGFTLLPVLYERAGFTEPALRDDQRRFRTDPTFVLALQTEAERRGVRSGIAVHSLRAAAPASVEALLEGARPGPVHIHVAEQVAEVEACVAATGCRPIEWLARNAPLGPLWQLVHATHTTPSEVEAVAAAGAGVVLCPTTEANLGDGFTDLPGWLREGVSLSVGSDSQVGRSALGEVLWLENGQRLIHRARNVAADPEREPSTAARLLGAVQHGGARAAGFSSWGFVPGARADLLVADPDTDALGGVPDDLALDALVFAGAEGCWRDVMVAGDWVIEHRRHPREREIDERYAAAMGELWGSSASR